MYERKQENNANVPPLSSHTVSWRVPLSVTPGLASSTFLSRNTYTRRVVNFYQINAGQRIPQPSQRKWASLPITYSVYSGIDTLLMTQLRILVVKKYGLETKVTYNKEQMKIYRMSIHDLRYPVAPLTLFSRYLASDILNPSGNTISLMSNMIWT